MKNLNSDSFYPDFAYPPEQIRKFLASPSANVITIVLVNGQILHPEIKDVDLFIKWLTLNGVENMKANNG